MFLALVRVALRAAGWFQEEVFMSRAPMKIFPAFWMPMPVTEEGPPEHMGLLGLPPPGLEPSASR